MAPKPDDPIKKEIPCECGKKNCNMGLIIGKYPGNKIKIQIIDKDIKTIVVDKEKILEMLKWN